MHRLAKSSVLIVGLRGLGCEIAKNVCLAGVRSVTLYDPAQVQVADLGTQFFLRQDDIGKPRDQSTLERLRELNRYVPVDVLQAPNLTPDILSRYQVVVLTDVGITRQLEINDYTHTHGVHFISADVRGLFG